MNLKLFIFPIMAILLCASYAHSQTNNDISAQKNLFETAQYINTLGTEGFKQCHSCESIEPYRPPSETWLEKAYRKYSALKERGRGFGIVGGGRLLGAGANYTVEILQYGSIFDLFTPKGLTFAAYCAGGVEAALELGSVSGGVAKIRTFGDCKEPDDYTGGFLNIGMQGSIEVLSINGQVSLGFDMNKFGRMLKNSFPVNNKAKKKKLRSQLFRLGMLMQEAALPFNPTIGLALMDTFGQKAVDYQKHEDKVSLAIDWAQGGDGTIFKEITQDLIDYIKVRGLPCLSSNCSNKDTNEIIEFLSIFNEGLQTCHAISVGASVGLAAALPISPTVGYNHFLKVAEIKITAADLGKFFAKWSSNQIKRGFNRLVNPCNVFGRMEKLDIEDWPSNEEFREAIQNLVKAKIDWLNANVMCQTTIMQSAIDTNRFLGTLIK